MGKRYSHRIEPAGKLLRTADLLVPLDNRPGPAVATITIKAGKGKGKGKREKAFRTEVIITPRRR